MRFRSRAAFALLALPFLAVLITTGRYILPEDDFEREDAYVAALNATVEGTVQGDLTLSVRGPVSVSGTVEGDLTILATGPVSVSGVVEGSARIATFGDVVIAGSVADDVLVAATALSLPGDAGRDVVFFGSSLAVDGTVARDLRGQALDVRLDALVGRDVDMSVQSLRVDASTEVVGDLLYRSASEASVSGGAKIGSLDRLPWRLTFNARVLVTWASLLGLLAFLFGGIAVFVLFRSTAARAASAVVLHPVRSTLFGMFVVLGLPIASALLIFTAVGIPLGLLILVLWIVVLMLGPVPALAVGGERVLRGRGGLVGAFLFAAILFRLLLWFTPLVGFLIYVVSLFLGSGSWALGLWELRREEMRSVRTVHDDGGGDWEAPLPPASPIQQGTTSTELASQTDLPDDGPARHVDGDDPMAGEGPLGGFSLDESLAPTTGIEEPDEEAGDADEAD